MKHACKHIGLFLWVRLAWAMLMTLSIAYAQIQEDEHKPYTNRLKPLLQQLRLQQNEQAKEALLNTHIELATLYENWEVFDKSAANLRQAVDLYLEIFGEQNIDMLEKLAIIHRKAGNNELALVEFRKLDTQLENTGLYEKRIRILNEITDIYRAFNRYEEALATNLRMLSLNKEKGDIEGTAISLNNIGFLHKFLGQNQQALESFLQALQLRQELKHLPSDYTILLSNIGIMYQNLGDHNHSLKYMFEALASIDAEKDPGQMAEVQNLLAIIYMGLNNFRDAMHYNEQALGLAAQHKLASSLQTVYRTRAELFEQTKNFKQALTFYKRHADVRDSLLALDRSASDAAVAKQLLIERTEQEMAILVVQKEIEELELKKVSLETEKQQQQLELLLRNQELQQATIRQQQLEQAQAQQDLKLVQQRLEAEKKDQEIVSLQKDNQIRALALQQQDLEEKDRLAQIALLESQKEIGNLQLKGERRLRNIFIGGLLLSIIILILLVRNTYIRRKANRRLREGKAEVESILTDLKQAQSQLVESEKMASLGQLTAGIAHELNNPIGFISSNIHALKTNFSEINQLLEKANLLQENGSKQESLEAFKALYAQIDAPFLQEEIAELLASIERGANRSSEIVSGLKFFSHAEQSSFIKADLSEVIETALMLLRNELKGHITVHKDYGDTPQIMCLPGKLSQVCMNILSNAIQAMEEKSSDETSAQDKIWLRTRNLGGQVEISIKDNGPGMDKELQKRIFEPFYTTKEIGKGTGLGLSISFGIIEHHQGKIEVISELGKGSEFIICLPVSQN